MTEVMKTEKNMKTYRIGNEIQIKWPILTNGEEVSLDGRRLSLYLSDQWGNDRKVETFGTEGNMIVFTFLASEQYKTGVYRLTLFENEGLEHQTACDYCFAFRLVAHSCDIPADMTVADLPLDSTNMEVGIHGLSAYEIAVNYGYEGSEEQWMREFQTVLSSTNLIVESVATAEQVLQRTEQLFSDLSDIQQAEQIRVSNEESRVLAEQGRDKAEGLRQSAEDERQRQEQTRQQTFESSEQRRSETFAESELQRQQTFETSEQQRSGSYEQAESRRDAFFSEAVGNIAESERSRVEAETLRNSSENTRNRQEAARVEEEMLRQESEQQRSSNENVRSNNENARIEAERIRIRNENSRQQLYNAVLSSEQQRVENEQDREDNEQRRNSETAAAIAAISGEHIVLKVLQTNSEVSINPNVKNVWETPMQQLTISFRDGDSRCDNEYIIQFTCPANAGTDLNLPSTVRWLDNNPLNPEPGYTYQISVVDNLAIYAGWEAASV